MSDTYAKIRQIFPRASDSFVALNRELPGANTQHSVRNDPLAKEKRENENPTRCLVRITSYRCGQLADADGLCGKYFVDALRYAGAIFNDRPQDIFYQIHQKRVAKKKEEKTLIEVLRVKE